MSEASSGRPSTETTPEDRLDSWKEIAAYLDRDVTTVQRWEKREGMPVHRHLHDQRGSVYASRAELDAWARSRNVPTAREDRAPSTSPQIAPSKARWRRVRPGLFLWAAAAAAVVLAAAILWFRSSNYSWRNPIADARLQPITEWDGLEQAAAISRDGQFIAFLSDRDGQMDVWITQVGSGQFHNLTRGTAQELVNPSIRTLGFSPDGSLVTFWVRKPGSGDVGIWAIPTLGGAPRPYLEGVAEYDWSRDGSRLVYHTAGPGDPLFVSSGDPQPGLRPIFTAPSGLHCHFPSWSPDGKFIYFVQGALPDKLDIWRIAPTAGNAERITSQNAPVSHPALLDANTLVYLASDADGSGPWLYGVDAGHRIPRRLTPGIDRYTSLAASADGRRLVVTIARPRRTLWRLRIGDSAGGTSVPASIPLTTGTGFSPRFGPDYLVYVSSVAGNDSVWKLAGGAAAELWHGQGARVVGGPAVSADGRSIAFSVRQDRRALLYVIQADGTNARVVANSLDLQGDPAWTPDGRSITTTANDRGVPHLFQVPVDGGRPVPFVREYSLGPAWSPDGRFVLFSGPDIGTTFSLKAVTSDAAVHRLPPLVLTRGGRHVTVLPGARSVVVLQGEIEHKDLWVIDLDTGARRQLTNLPADFNVRDFALSPDGREVVLERVADRSDVALLQLK